jgi:hypothetical protein
MKGLIKSMGKTITFVIGVVVGFLLSVAAYFYISFQTIGDPPKSRVEFTNKQIQEKQNELGMTCAEAPDVIRKYLDSIPPFIEKLSKNERIDSSNFILLEGNRVREIFYTCDKLNRMAKAAHIEFPLSPMVEDEKLSTSITAINLSLNQAAAAWCESKCIADALQKVTSFMSIAKERLASTVVTK